MTSKSPDDQFIDEVLKRLEKNQELARRLYHLIGDEFVHKKDFREMLDELRKLREETTKRFEEMDKRFEELIVETTKRFEEMDKRFEELIVETTKRFEAVDQRFDKTDAQLAQLGSDILEVKVAIGSLGRRSGYGLEQTMLELFRTALNMRAIDVDKVEKIRRTDRKGEFYSPGTRIDIDMYVHDGRHFFFEIKYHPTIEDLENFARKAQFIKKDLALKEVHLALIALEISEEVREHCKKLAIEIITRS